MNYRHPPDVLARTLKLFSLQQAQRSLTRMVRQSLLQSISVRQSCELLESRFCPLIGFAFNVGNDSATPDGTVGGIAGGVEPDSATAWRSQNGLHEEGTPSRGYRQRPPRLRHADGPRLSRSDGFTVGVAASGKARDGVPHPARDARGDSAGR